MGQGGRHHRQPDGAFLGGGGGVFPGGSRSGHAPVIRLLHAVGPLRHLSFPGLPHSRGVVFQGQSGNSADTQGPVHPPLGGPGTQPLQRYLEVQHPRREVLRRKPPTRTKPSLLGRRGVFRPSSRGYPTSPTTWLPSASCWARPCFARWEGKGRHSSLCAGF